MEKQQRSEIKLSSRDERLSETPRTTTALCRIEGFKGGPQLPNLTTEKTALPEIGMAKLQMRSDICTAVSRDRRLSETPLGPPQHIVVLKGLREESPIGPPMMMLV